MSLPSYVVLDQRVHSHKDVLRKILIGADEMGAWLTLAELADFTSYGEASISAELRNLRKDGFHISKRIRFGQTWEYRIGIHPFKGGTLGCQ